MKYEKPVVGRFKFNDKVVVDATLIENKYGHGEGYIVKHPHYEEGDFHTDWLQFTNPDWIQIPIEEEENMNNVQQRIEALQQPINNSQKELEELQNALEEHNNKKVEKKKIDWSKVPVDTPIIARFRGGFRCRHFAGVVGEHLVAFDKGQSSFSSEHHQVRWNNMEIAFDNCKWQPWFGGERPFPEGILVDIVYRCGKKHECTVMRNPVCWEHNNDSCDIIAYRISGLEEGYCF